MTFSNIERACKELDLVYMDNKNSHWFKLSNGWRFVIFSYDWKHVTIDFHTADKETIDKFIQLYTIIHTDQELLELI